MEARTRDLRSGRCARGASANADLFSFDSSEVGVARLPSRRTRFRDWFVFIR